MSAIILVFAVSLILSNIFYRHQIDVSQAARSLHSDQAFLIALSGEGWATELLFEEIDCPICSETKMVKRVTNCNHSFCEQCLNEWLQSSKKCPICMVELE